MEEWAHGLEIRDWFSIDVFGCEYPESRDFYDRNWLVVGLSAKDQVSEVHMRGTYLLTCELRDLLKGAHGLLAGKVQEFVLSTIEPTLKLSFRKRDDCRHFGVRLALESELADRGPDISHLVHSYELGIDQTDVQILERQLGKLLKAYPVMGRP